MDLAGTCVNICFIAYLAGPNDDFLGPRFFAVSDAYDSDLQNIALKEAKALNYSDFVRPDGTYCYVSGPSYESKAECRFLRSIGGDCVGMSTIPEVLAARHCGMKILGLSLITNKVVMSDVKARHVASKPEKHATHEEVLEAVQESGKRVEKLVEAIVSENNLRAILDKVGPLPPRKPTKSMVGVKKEISGLPGVTILVPFLMAIIGISMNSNSNTSS